MVAVVLWVAILIRKHGLLACILENFANITTPYGSSYRRMTEHSMKVLDLFLPEFSWRIDTLALSDYMRPQTRVRVFIRGLRRSVAESVPRCLPPFGKCTLRNVLVHAWPTHPRWRLTQQQQYTAQQQRMQKGAVANAYTLSYLSRLSYQSMSYLLLSESCA